MRADGKKLKNVDPMYKIAPYIMDKRYDAMNMITIDIPYEPMQRYINEKRNNGIKTPRAATRGISICVRLDSHFFCLCLL